MINLKYSCVGTKVPFLGTCLGGELAVWLLISRVRAFKKHDLGSRMPETVVPGL